MNNWITKNGYEISQVLADRSNSYFISNGNQNILVDTGKKSSYRKLLKNIDSLSLTQKAIAFIILTHTHFDHCRNTAEIRKNEKCKVLVSSKDSEFIIKGYTPLPKGVFLLAEIISDLGNEIGKKMFGYTPFNADRLIDDKFDMNPEGIKIEIISTPGHSKGCISVIVDSEIALVGDTMIGTFKNFIFPPFSDDVKTMINSWGRLLDTNCEIFLPGHGRAIGRKLLQKEYNKYASKFNIDRYKLK